MISFLLSLAVLLIGYFIYGRFIENVFGPDDRETPAVRINDGVDCISLKTWKAFLIQLLNIELNSPCPCFVLKFSNHVVSFLLAFSDLG